MPGYVVVLLSIVLFLAVVYTIGSIAGQVVGRKLILLGESILRRIPIVKTIYGASRQAVDALSIQGKGETYQAAVIVPFPSPTAKAIAFVTGKLDIEGEGNFYRVFIPTTPNPTSGFLEIYPSNTVEHTNLSVEDAVMTIMSAGILIPKDVRMEGNETIDPSSSFLADAVSGAPRSRTARHDSVVARFGRGIRKRMISGLLVLIPIGITAFVLDLIYALTAGQITPLTQWLVGPLPGYIKVAVSIALLIALLYLTGYVATAVVGARLIHWIETLLKRVPLVTTVYTASKQIVASLIDTASGPKFQAPVLVPFPHRGARTIGFLMGDIRSASGKRYFKVFVPTTPNVTVGLLEFFEDFEVSGCSLSLEEAIKMVVSGGIVGPGSISTFPLPETSHSEVEHTIVDA
jgi:uncharacterized membrane protein